MNVLNQMHFVVHLVRNKCLLCSNDSQSLPPPPRGNFVDHIFLKAQCLARILQHVSPLTMAALSCKQPVTYVTLQNI